MMRQIALIVPVLLAALALWNPPLAWLREGVIYVSPQGSNWHSGRSPDFVVAKNLTAGAALQSTSQFRVYLLQGMYMSYLAAKFFTTVGGVATHLPVFKGKDGIFLRLFNILGLKSQHVFVDTVLHAPVRYRVRLDLHSWLQRLAYLSGGYEASTVHFLVKVRESIGNAGYVLDIGANIGLIGIPTALIISKTADAQSVKPYVVCIEAVPDNEKALRHNVELNDALQFMSVIGIGLGDVSGTVHIQVEGDLNSGEGTGTANVLPAGSTYECVKIPIQITTIDALMHSTALPGNCTLIKIDTDGYDLKILKGGREFLSQYRPVIYGEFAAGCLKWHGESILDVVEFAKSINYLVWPRLPSRDFKFTQSIDAKDFSQDLMLIPSEHANTLAWCCPA